MFGLYLRLLLFVAGLIGAVFLFVFTFTAAAIALIVVLVLLALTGRMPRVERWAQRGPGAHFEPGPGAHFEHESDSAAGRKPPLVIDHDPNDLPDK